MYKSKAVIMTFEKKFLQGAVLCAMAVLSLGACASSPSAETMDGMAEIYDPMENSNRRVFAFNQAIDGAFINPVVKGYEVAVPKPARTGIDNALRNLRTPTTLMNQVLQGDWGGAGTVIERAIINTILGVGGLFDVAAYEGIEYEAEDFGQTLAKWGVGHGPYLVVPIIGPSSARDYAGFFVDTYADPLRWYAFNVDKEGLYYGKLGLEYLNLRSSLIDILAELEASSIDYYAATRSAYYQRREALVNDQDPELSGAMPSIPAYDDYE